MRERKVDVHEDKWLYSTVTNVDNCLDYHIFLMWFVLSCTKGARSSCWHFDVPSWESLWSYSLHSWLLFAVLVTLPTSLSWTGWRSRSGSIFWFPMTTIMQQVIVRRWSWRKDLSTNKWTVVEDYVINLLITKRNQSLIMHTVISTVQTPITDNLQLPQEVKKKVAISLLVSLQICTN